eukprot:gnl/TRDRNA2_/TRDRNA2_193584_c0_seq1.p1 gnl/TRDRNA2_/TRDRNA2_193584_c0~~gnl/TRDRNA2_/TRDRNA2_193584_c0_seq1.p1  ORF type:complete len:144 (+),score=17.97 gnl/TRDRNA2_/TRDRNA2_193584_c0_seq1:94-525(+)
MAHALQHLHSAWAVEQAVVGGEDSKVVCLRFGHDYDPECVLMDENLAAVLSSIEAMCNVFLVDIDEVPEFTQQYELYDPCTLMFFFRGRHVQLELGIGDRYKITWPICGNQELIDILEAVHRGAQQGRDLVVASKEYSLAYRY